MGSFSADDLRPEQLEKEDISGSFIAVTPAAPLQSSSEAE